MQWSISHCSCPLRSRRPSKAAAEPQSDRQGQNPQAVIAAEIRCQIPAAVCAAAFPGADVPAPAEGKALFPAGVLAGVGAVAGAFGMHRVLCCGYKSRQLGEHIGYTSRSPA